MYTCRRVLHGRLTGLCTGVRTRPGCYWCDRGVRSFLKKTSARALKSALGALTDASCEFLDVIEDLTSVGHFGQDLSLRVHDRGVVAPECLADLGK